MDDCQTNASLMAWVYARFDAWCAANDPEGCWDLLEQIEAYAAGYERGDDCG